MIAVKIYRVLILGILISSMIACSTNPVWGLFDKESANSDEFLFFALLGLTNSNASESENSGNFKYIFTTATTYDGGLFDGGPGVSQMDAKCNADANRPDTSLNYKALIAVPTRRDACTTANCSGGTAEHLDWVMSVNQEYRRSDGQTIIGTTTSNAGIFDLTVGLVNSFSASGQNYWTGLTATWITGLANQVCTNGAGWNESTGSSNGYTGNPAVTNNNSISTALIACNVPQALLCVEQ